jgi:hypothetical protein
LAVLIATAEPLDPLDVFDTFDPVVPPYRFEDDAGVADDAALELEPELLPHAATVKATAATAAIPPTRNRKLFHLFIVAPALMFTHRR